MRINLIVFEQLHIFFDGGRKKNILFSLSYIKFNPPQKLSKTKQRESNESTDRERVLCSESFQTNKHHACFP